MADARFTIVLAVTVRAGAEETFFAYEALVLPLLERYGGRLERRLRGRDEDGRLCETHIVSFESEDGFVAYRGDPERVAAAHLWEESVAESGLLRVEDVGD